MVEAIIGAGIAFCAMILVLLARKGIIEMPYSSNHLQFMAFFIFIFCGGVGIGIYSAGTSSVLCLGPIFIIGLIGFAVGYTYYKRKDKKGKDVQTLNLND